MNADGVVSVRRCTATERFMKTEGPWLYDIGFSDYEDSVYKSAHVVINRNPYIILLQKECCDVYVYVDPSGFP